MLFDKVMNLRVADGPYLYRAQRHGTPKQKSGVITDAKINIAGNKLTIRGWLAGIEIEHTFTLPADRPILEERIVLHNKTGELIALSGFEAGLTRRVTDKQGRVLPELAAARVVAVPFRHRAIDAKGHFNDFSIHDLVTQPGSESWVNQDLSFFTVPSRHRWSEAWAVSVGKHTLGIFSFNQENMVFSVLSTVAGAEGTSLRFGGAVMLQGEPAALTRIAPGGSVDLGTTRFETIEGGYPEAMYAYRAMLDEKGCRFPKDFNPPVHWEQLYDMNGAWEDRAASLHEGDHRARSGEGARLQLRSDLSRSRLGHRFRHLPLGREMARPTKAVHRRDAVEVRAEGVAAHAAGYVDVAYEAQLGHWGGR